MKAVYLEGPQNVYIKDIEKPEWKEGYALVKIVTMGICGSDVGAYRGVNKIVQYPVILGHELAGIVEEISPDNKSGVKVGDRVVLDPFIWCGECTACKKGRPNACEHLKTLGVMTDGGMRDYILHPDHLLVKIPDEVPWDLAPLSEPLAIALHGYHRAKVQAGEYYAINGAGAIGLLGAMIANAYGAHPILIDPIQARLDFAKNVCGIELTTTPDKAHDFIYEVTDGRGADAVYEASGASPAIAACIDYASYAGRIVYTGWPKGLTEMNTNDITKKELDIYGGRNNKGEFPECLELIRRGKVDVRNIITKTIGIEEAPQALKDLSEHPADYLKIVIING